MGQNFLELHKLFESQYESLAEEVDEVAEKIRSLGFLVQANFEDLQKGKSIKNADEKLSSTDMIKDLISSRKEICAQIKKLIKDFEQKEDVSTVDLLTQSIARHEKQIWFLESFVS